MKTTTLFALVAAATMGFASPSPAEAGEEGEEHYSAPPAYDGGGSYDPPRPKPHPKPHPAPPSYYSAPPSYGGGGGGGWGHGGGGGGGGGWGGHKGGRFGGHSWGGSSGGGGGGGKYYGSCHTCLPVPRGFPIPPPDHPGWPVDPDDFPPGPFRKHFHEIGNKCSSVNNVGNGDHAAGCCNKAGTSDGGDENGGGGLLGGLLNGLLAGGPTCTLDILSSLCSSGSVACCPVQDSGNGFSIVNVQGVCLPITL